VNLVELGPGRGTLMADILRIGRQMPDWLNAIELHLVEINPALRKLQVDALSPYRPQWHDRLGTLPQDGPVMLVANEFFDALPIRQLVFWDGTWRERLVDWTAEAGFYFAISPKPSSLTFLVPAGLSAEQGSLYELSPTVIAVGTEIAQRIAAQGGAALLIDYGKTESGLGQSLQAVKAHRMVALLDDPGNADLSAHVDFCVLRRLADDAGARPAGPVTQGEFLNALGIGMRLERLKRDLPTGESDDTAAALDRAVQRLTTPAAMGRLFKALAITCPAIVPAGFVPAAFGPPSS
jgi:NADH dehydrogenase [ubiquinone] 1 alpha subcomplex assembly factor 7